MGVIQNEDKNTGAVPASPSEEKTEVNPTIPPVEEKKGGSEDIDFKKELENLEGTTPPVKPKRTKLEEAAYNLKKNADRFKEMGGDPSEVLGTEVKADDTNDEKEGEYVTKSDLARIEAKKLAKSDDELKVIMWWVEKKGMSVEDAHWQANKGRIQKTLGEVQRKQSATPGIGGGPGERPADVIKKSPEDEAMLRRDGFNWNPKTKTYQAKFNEEFYNTATKQWETRRIQK